MNKKKVKNLLQEIEKLHYATDIANYIPTFEIDSFTIEGDLENSMNKFLSSHWKSDAKFTLKLTELPNFNRIVLMKIDKWLKHCPLGDKLKYEEKIIELADNFKKELLCKEISRVFKVETTHEGWYEASWDDFLFIENEEAHFLHLGVSD